MKNIEKIKEKYKGLCFGYFNYKDQEYFIDDFLNEDFVVDWIIVTVGDHDQGITEEGIDFINEYYRNEYIIRKVLEKYGKFPFDSGNPYSFLEEHRKRAYVPIENRQISIKTGYEAMICTLHSLLELTGNNDVTTIVRGGFYTSEDKPADPAFWKYWLEALKEVEEKGPMYLELYNKHEEKKKKE